MRRFLTVLIVLLAIPGTLHAHVRMMECSPLQDAVLNEAPEKVTVSFLGSVEPAFSRVEVFGPDGKMISDKTTYHESDTVMEVELKGDMAPGVYTVKWKCMSLDGHKQTGEFNFTIE